MNSKPFFIVAEKNIGMYPAFIDKPIDSVVLLKTFETNQEFIDYFKTHFTEDLGLRDIRFADNITKERRITFLEECRLQGLQFGNFQ